MTTGSRAELVPVESLAGSEAVLDRFVREHYPRLDRLAGLVCRRPSDAEDADDCPRTLPGRTSGGSVVLPAFYWIATLEPPGADVWVVAGSDTRAQLDEFLPRARALIGSIDFDSSAVVSKPPPGSEPVPLPSDEWPFIGAEAFGRELRYISPSAPAPAVTPERAIEITADRYRAERGSDSLPDRFADPIGVVCRVLRAKDLTELRSVWVVVLRYPSGHGFYSAYIDDQTGEVVGIFAVE
jgi:hypothetical protein